MSDILSLKLFYFQVINFSVLSPSLPTDTNSLLINFSSLTNTLGKYCKERLFFFLARFQRLQSIHNWQAVLLVGLEERLWHKLFTLLPPTSPTHLLPITKPCLPQFLTCQPHLSCEPSEVRTLGSSCFWKCPQRQTQGLVLLISFILH